MFFFLVWWSEGAREERREVRRREEGERGEWESALSSLSRSASRSSAAVPPRPARPAAAAACAPCAQSRARARLLRGELRGGRKQAREKREEEGQALLNKALLSLRGPAPLSRALSLRGGRGGGEPSCRALLLTVSLMHRQLVLMPDMVAASELEEGGAAFALGLSLSLSCFRSRVVSRCVCV